MLFLNIAFFLPYNTHNSCLVLLVRSRTQHSTLMYQGKLTPGAPSNDNLLRSKTDPPVWVQSENYC